MTQRRSHARTPGRTLAAALAAVCACIVAPFGSSAADWQPADVRRMSAPPGDVVAALAQLAAPADPRFAQRRERWTYLNDGHRYAVRVAVKDADYRVDVALGTAAYAAGRLKGVPWRSDANGVVHATYSEAQGDALDRVPRGVFALDRADLTLAGETRSAAPPWVFADRPARDKPHWLYVDRATGEIVREVVREGARTIVITFDRFEPAGGARRPRHWRVSDGDRTHDLDVEVDEVLPRAVDAAAVALPAEQRTFAPFGAAPPAALTLPTHFDDDTILVDVTLDGQRSTMILDTGTASILLDSTTARRLHVSPVLEHATIPTIAVGGLGLSDVSVLAVPFTGFGGEVSGILGLDFFFGHVVHIDYQNRRVEVLEHDAAERIFHDPAYTVLPADVGEGLPLVQGSFGSAYGTRFAIDTGSPHLYVLDAFERRWAGEIAAHWSPARFAEGSATRTASYLEGPIGVSARRPASFALGPLRFPNVLVGVENRGIVQDGISIPLDGIIGTDELTHLDLWFDYDNDRLAIRPNGT